MLEHLGADVALVLFCIFVLQGMLLNPLFVKADVATSWFLAFMQLEQEIQNNFIFNWDKINLTQTRRTYFVSNFWIVYFVNEQHVNI